MSAQVERVIRKSSDDFLKVVWPLIGRDFGTPIPVETVTSNAFAKELDTRAGIDVWLISVDGHMRGLASRVQWTDRSYDTFTVRMKSRYGGPTEYHKRKREIAAPGSITPHYFCQAYVSVDRSKLVAAAIACVRDVISAVDLDMGRLMPPNPDGTQGYAVPWSALSNNGARIHIWPDPEPTLFAEGA